MSARDFSVTYRTNRAERCGGRVASREIIERRPTDHRHQRHDAFVAI
jgi:hypothetical protein